MSASSLEPLRTFLNLCDTLSFSKTAKQLRLSQPSISRHITTLEESLGVELFIRDRRRVQISKEGARLRNELGPALGHLDEVLHHFTDAHKAIAGPIAFGCVTELGQNVFMPLLLAFQKEHPGVEFDVRYSREVDIVEGLRSGALDFGILTEEIGSQNLRLYPVGSERAVVVTRGSNTRPFRPDTKTEWIAYRRDDPLLDLFLRKHHPEQIKSVRFRTLVNSHRSMVDALAGCDAYAVMPDHSVERELSSGRLRIAGNKELEKKLYLACQDGVLTLKRNALFKAFFLSKSRTPA